MKKHGVFLVPQSLDLMTSNRQYFDQQEKDMQQHEVENYFSLHNTTRHLDTSSNKK
jgi:hypothetical protein